MWAGLVGIDNLGGLVWTGLVCRGSPSPLSVPLVISGGDGDAAAAASRSLMGATGRHCRDSRDSATGQRAADVKIGMIAGPAAAAQAAGAGGHGDGATAAARGELGVECVRCALVGSAGSDVGFGSVAV